MFSTISVMQLSEYTPYVFHHLRHQAFRYHPHFFYPPQIVSAAAPGLLPASLHPAATLNLSYVLTTLSTPSCTADRLLGSYSPPQAAAAGAAAAGGAAAAVIEVGSKESGVGGNSAIDGAGAAAAALAMASHFGEFWPFGLLQFTRVCHPLSWLSG